MTENNAPEVRRAIRWGPAIAIAALIAVVVVLVMNSTGAPNDPERDPLELSDQRELRVVTIAVSAVVRADSDSDEERALATLEALHPRSPGAADLRDSCVTTYRGTHDAENLTRQVRAMVSVDGGAPSVSDQSRMSELLDRSQRLVTEARESHQRCVSLYEISAQRLGITPARRNR